MKNSVILIIILVLIISLSYYIGCNNDVISPITGSYDPGILRTDELGNILGGDTTDWCLHDSGSVRFGAAYPNPTSISVNVPYYLPVEDTIMIYFLRSSTDTTVFYDGRAIPGSHTLYIYDSTNQYKNTYQRVYFKSKHFSSSAYCRFYGDIKFEE